MIRKHPGKINDYATLALMLVCEFLPISFVIYWLFN